MLPAERNNRSIGNKRNEREYECTKQKRKKGNSTGKATKRKQDLKTLEN
jgi:hypothetical protein